MQPQYAVKVPRSFLGTSSVALANKESQVFCHPPTTINTPSACKYIIRSTLSSTINRSKQGLAILCSTYFLYERVLPITYCIHTPTVKDRTRSRQVWQSPLTLISAQTPWEVTCIRHNNFAWTHACIASKQQSFILSSLGTTTTTFTLHANYLSPRVSTKSFCRSGHCPLPPFRL